MENLIKNSKFANNLTFVGNDIKVWHYSGDKFGEISPSYFGKGSQTKQEVKTWNYPRAFFYGNERGFMSDKGISRIYKYVATIPSDKLYPIQENPLNYNDGKIDFNLIQKEAKKDGYIGFIYSWNKDGSNPIIAVWESVKPDTIYYDRSGEGYVEVKADEHERVGHIKDKYGNKLNVYKAGDYYYYLDGAKKNFIYQTDNIIFERKINLKKVIKESVSEKIKNMKFLSSVDDYSTKLIKEGDHKIYEDSYNKSHISESSLSRALTFMKDNVFAIITAYRGKYSKEENIKRNRILRTKLNDMKMGVHQLVGHWMECQARDENGEPLPYNKCPKNKLIDVIERSYLVKKPNDMLEEKFKNIMIELLTIEGETQDGFLMKKSNGDIVIVESNGNEFKIGDKLNVNKISQAYSQHVKKLETPFIFEGMEIPNGSITSYRIFKNNNIQYF
ncbi:MAG: hypothetical protein ACOC33_00370 [bacterium]